MGRLRVIFLWLCVGGLLVVGCDVEKSFIFK